MIVVLYITGATVTPLKEMLAATIAVYVVVSVASGKKDLEPAQA